MKKLLAIFILILFVSFPVFAKEYQIDILYRRQTEDITNAIRSDGSFVYEKKQDGSMKILNGRMEVITDGVYNYTENNFINGLLLVEEEIFIGDEAVKLYGFINSGGMLVIDTIYTRLCEFFEDKTIGVLNGQTVLIDKSGNIIANYGREYGYFSRFVNGYAVVRDEGFSDKSFFGIKGTVTLYFTNIMRTDAIPDIANEISKNSKEGFYIIDIWGNKIIEDIQADVAINSYVHTQHADYTKDVTVELTLDCYFTAEGISIVRKNDKYGIMNKSGDILCDFILFDYRVKGDKIYGITDENGFSANRTSDNETFVFDKFGDLTYKNEYAYIMEYSYYYSGNYKPNQTQSDEAFIIRLKGDYGLISADNKLLIPPEYNSVMPVGDDYEMFQVRKNDKVGILNKRNEFLIPLSYSADENPIDYYTFTAIEKDYSLLVAGRYGKYGVVSIENEEIIPCIYDSIFDFTNRYISEFQDSFYKDYGLILGKKDGMIYVISVSDRKVLAEYEDVGMLGNSLFKVKKDGRFGISNVENELLIPIEYDNIYEYYPSVFRVQKDEKQGVLNANNEIIVPAVYDFVYRSSIEENNEFFVIKQGEIYSIYSVREKALLKFTSENKDSADAYMKELFPQKEAEPQIKTNKNYYTNSAVSYSEGSRYYNSDSELIFYYTSDKTYDKNKNEIFDLAAAVDLGWSKASAAQIYADLSVYWLGNIISKSGLIAVNELPMPNTSADKYICLMLNNPLINVNGNISMLEKDNYFLTPFIENDCTLVPVRTLFEALNADVYWDNETKTATAIKGETEIRITIDNDEMYVNGKRVLLDTPARLKYGRTAMPLRAVSEALSAKVDFSDETGLITIIY